MKINLINLKNKFAYILIISLLLQFLKAVTPLYMLTLGSIFIISTLVILTTKLNKVSISHVSIYYLLFLISLIFVALNTLLTFSKYEIDLQSYIIGNIRMWPLPLLPLFLMGLLSKSKKLEIVINIYILFIFLAAISIYLQHFLGEFEFFSQSYDKRRMGYENKIDGFASLTGNVTTYGASFYSAIIFIFFHKLNLPLLKSILISAILGAAILTMSKTGLVMAMLVVFIIFILSISYKHYRLILYLIIIGLIGSMVFYEYFVAAFITMFVNTFGIEIYNVSISTTTQWQDFLPRVTDRIFGVFFMATFADYTLYEKIFGIGLFGGGGAFGFKSGTSHNSFLDLYSMGGVIIIFPFLALFLKVQIELFKSYRKNMGELYLAFFISNCFLFLLYNVNNGAVFHPAISIPFWCSIYFLMHYNKKKHLN